MSYKKDQGRYARMSAFWALFLLVAYGCLHAGGLVTVLDGWLGDDLSRPWVQPFPLLGKLSLSMAIALALLTASGLVIYRYLARPRVADLLIDTEGELRKVTWPTAGETWSGTLAVAITVAVLLAFLQLSDLMLTFLVRQFLGLGGAS